MDAILIGSFNKSMSVGGMFTASIIWPRQGTYLSWEEKSIAKYQSYIWASLSAGMGIRHNLQICTVPVPVNFHTQDSSWLSMEVYLLSYHPAQYTQPYLHVHTVCLHASTWGEFQETSHSLPAVNMLNLTACLCWKGWIVWGSKSYFFVLHIQARFDKMCH